MRHTDFAAARAATTENSPLSGPTYQRPSARRTTAPRSAADAGIDHADEDVAARQPLRERGEQMRARRGR